MIELKDNGERITETSLEFWRNDKHLIGRVKEVKCSYDPLASDTLVAAKGGYNREYNLRIIGSKGGIYLSGCSCGYSGEGPHGTRQILVELGVEPVEAVRLSRQRRFSITIGNGGG